MLELKNDQMMDSPSVLGALYFLESGHYLLRYKRDENRPVVSKTLIAPDVAAAFTQKEADTGWIKPGIQRAGRNQSGDWYVYFHPHCYKTITLIQTKQETAKITIPIPATVLIGSGHAHFIFALADDVFDPSAKAYLAPFPNVDDNGSICFGDNPQQSAHHSNAGQVWDLFFEAPFNGHQTNGKSKIEKTDIRRMLIGLADFQEDYPIEDMVGDGIIGRHIERIIKC